MWVFRECAEEINYACGVASIRLSQQRINTNKKKRTRAITITEQKAYLKMC